MSNTKPVLVIGECREPASLPSDEEQWANLTDEERERLDNGRQHLAEVDCP